ncbi:unnamed protein product [Brachionus calyciflorus]|uniref:Uncharacterized protein n=1 Tax=Brachionus calyciflorus TaxID=104777 RepID=A0A814AEE9_9BILA|nr:unnamed protein product [Brachionus calyciflorus]
MRRILLSKRDEFKKMLDQMQEAKLIQPNNTSTNGTTNHTPFEVVYGRKPKISLDLVIENETETNEEIYELAETDKESLVVKILVDELQEKLREVYKNVEQNRDYMVEKSRIQNDRNIKPVEYKVEDMLKHVMLKQPRMKKGLSKKLSPKWDCPYIIQDKLGPVNYKIKKIKSAKFKANIDKTPDTRKSNEVQNEQQEFLINSSESVKESTDDDDETFKPNHFFQALLNGSNNQPDDSQNQPHILRSKRITKPVDRFKY